MSEQDHLRQTRQRTLTDADMQALAEMLQTQHYCRIDNLSREDVDFIKDLLTMYKETRSVVLKVLISWFLKFFLIVSAVIVCTGLYLKYGPKK